MPKWPPFSSQVKQNILYANFNFKLNGKRIPWKTDYKYLGIYLDYKLIMLERQHKNF